MPRNILLVDDEVSVREIVKEFLALSQYNVVEANNGAEALSFFKRGQFDLVIIDLKMPFVTGDELAIMIKRLVPRQPIIMITAWARMVEQFKQVDVLLSKPIDFPHLQSVIAQLLGEELPVRG